MKKWMLFLMAVLFVATQAVAQQTPPQRVTPQAGEIPQIVAYDNDGLLGDHIHIFGNTTDLGKWNNSISSMVILAGRWEFFDEEKGLDHGVGHFRPLSITRHRHLLTYHGTAMSHEGLCQVF